MKTAGINADNYKIEKFKKELTKAGFTDFEVVPFTKDTSLIKVKYEPKNLKKVEKVCQLVQMHFQQSN